MNILKTCLKIMRVVCAVCIFGFVVSCTKDVHLNDAYTFILVCLTAKENLILNMKKKKALMSPKPLRIRRSLNPFKKAKEEPATVNRLCFLLCFIFTFRS